MTLGLLFTTCIKINLRSHSTFCLKIRTEGHFEKIQLPKIQDSLDTFYRIKSNASFLLVKFNSEDENNGFKATDLDRLFLYNRNEIVGRKNKMHHLFLIIFDDNSSCRWNGFYKVGQGTCCSRKKYCRNIKRRR